jgi:hypothetical protein
MWCFCLAILRTLCSVCEIQRKVASVEISIAPHGSGTSVHNLNMLLNHPLKSQVTQHTFNEDMKKSADLRDIPPLTSPELKVRSLVRLQNTTPHLTGIHRNLNLLGSSWMAGRCLSIAHGFPLGASSTASILACSFLSIICPAATFS